MPAKTTCPGGSGSRICNPISQKKSAEDSFATISPYDTNTLFVSNGITQTLGYQQDMLIGQSLLGYLYPGIE